MRDMITPIILTYNEAPNLLRTLEKLTWARQIIIIDSFSMDETLSIAKQFPQVKVFQRRFDQFADQRNFGSDSCLSDWVLALDADYVLSDELLTELQNWEPESGVAAYFSRFTYCVSGVPLRISLYPPRPVLFRRDKCRYYRDGHSESLKIEGRTSWLQNTILHDDRKPFVRWLAAQDSYALLEANKLMQCPARQLNLEDRIRRQILFAPALVFFYTLFAKGLILDGWVGWYYVFQRTLVELLISLRLLETRWGLPTTAKDHEPREEYAPGRTSI